MATYRKTNTTKKFYKINQYINAPIVRLLDEDGKQIDVMPIDQARNLSRESGLDLVEISGSANPPVIKLIDFSKFKYQEAKKAKSEKRGIKGGELKEIQMTPFIGVADYETRLKRAKEFLSTGNKVKLSIKFQGRQITRKEFGYNLIDKFKADLADISVPEGEPRLMGKRLLFTLTPVKKKKIQGEQNGKS
ncbi:MAG TPA: translation initiation factor IF-3 [Patescibacteria group bacterium]